MYGNVELIEVTPHIYEGQTDFLVDRIIVIIII